MLDEIRGAVRNNLPVANLVCLTSCQRLLLHMNVRAFLALDHFVGLVVVEIDQIDNDLFLVRHTFRRVIL